MISHTVTSITTVDLLNCLDWIAIKVILTKAEAMPNTRSIMKTSGKVVGEPEEKCYCSRFALLNPISVK